MQKGLIKSNVVDLDDASGIITVAANAFGNIDSDRDISMPGSFLKTIKENFARLRWLKNHNREQVLGVQLEAKETDEFLVVRGKINLDKQIGRDTYSDYKLFAEHGLSLEHSIGVDAIKFIEDRENRVRRVQEWKWWEWSTLDSWAANDRALTLDIKSAGDPSQLLTTLGVLELKLHKGNYTDETFIGIEQQINNIKSLLMQEEVLHQPVPINALSDVFADFLKTI